MEYNNYGNNNRFSNRPPVPVKEGDTYSVTIEGIGEKGDGIAKVQGFVIIVPKTQQGQQCQVRITAVRGKVAFGEVVGEASAPSADSATEEAEGEAEETQEPAEDEE